MEQYRHPELNIDLIGITGGIGSGKSTVSNLLRRANLQIVDLDEISKGLMKPKNSGYEFIKNQFPKFLDDHGFIDTKKFRSIFFTNPEIRKYVESILHPLIHEAALIKLSNISKINSNTLAGIEIPILTRDSKWYQRFKHVLVVDCTQNTQIARVIHRNGLQENEVLSILKTQTSRSERLLLADSVIYNENCTLTVLESEVLTWYSNLTDHHPPITERRA